MKRWYVILLTLATLFAGDRLGGLLLDNLLYRSEQRFPSLYEGRFNADLVCIGNSRGVYAFDTPFVHQQTGTSIANISHNGMSPTVARAIFADYLDHNRKPKVLVIEVTCVLSAPTDDLVLDYKPFWGRSDRLRKLGQTVSPETAWACRVSWLYRYNAEMFWRVLSYWLRGANDQAIFMQQQISPELIAEVEHSEPFELHPAPGQLEALAALVHCARDAGIRVELVCDPYLPAYAQRITNLDSFLAEICDATGQPVLDFSRVLSDANQFGDRVHLRRSGCRAVSELMLRQGVFDLREPRAPMVSVHRDDVSR